MAQPITIAQANQLQLTLTNSRLDPQQVHNRLRLCTFYLHKTLDVNLSLNSALTIAQQARILSHHLCYTKGDEDAAFLQGSVYVRQRKTDLVERMLNSVNDTNHIRLLLELIHQKLYRSEGIARIPMQAYIRELVTYLKESYELPQPIRFELIIDPVELDQPQAIPLGLIINEAITNTLKYPFPAGRAGEVHVKLSTIGAGQYELMIADDGVGLPVDFDPTQSRSLYMASGSNSGDSSRLMVSQD